MTDSLEELYEIVKKTIILIPNQVRQAWDEVNSLDIPEEFSSVKNIVFCGMGGSALGARVVKSLTRQTLSIPFEISTEYSLPNYVSRETLVIASSYSGTTEETIASASEAIEKKVNFFAITTGGTLGQTVKEKDLPGYVFSPQSNPSGQPRMAIGYAVASLLALLAKTGLLTISKGEVNEALDFMSKAISKYVDELPSNPAKSLAASLQDKVPVIIASEHLLGVAHTFKNQLNESAKTFSCLFDLPELNHHLMESLINPPSNKEILSFVFLKSNLYSPKIIKRYPLTAEVVEKNGVIQTSFTSEANDKLSQVFETLIFASFVVYYLTRSYSINPMEIPWVDYFKKKLAK